MFFHIVLILGLSVCRALVETCNFKARRHCSPGQRSGQEDWPADTPEELFTSIAVSFICISAICYNGQTRDSVTKMINTHLKSYRNIVRVQQPDINERQS